MKHYLRRHTSAGIARLAQARQRAVGIRTCGSDEQVELPVTFDATASRSRPGRSRSEARLGTVPPARSNAEDADRRHRSGSSSSACRRCGRLVQLPARAAGRGRQRRPSISPSATCAAAAPAELPVTLRTLVRERAAVVRGLSRIHLRAARCRRRRAQRRQSTTLEEEAASRPTGRRHQPLTPRRRRSGAAPSQAARPAQVRGAARAGGRAGVPATPTARQPAHERVRCGRPRCSLGIAAEHWAGHRDRLASRSSCSTTAASRSPARRSRSTPSAPPTTRTASAWSAASTPTRASRETTRLAADLHGHAPTRTGCSLRTSRRRVRRGRCCEARGARRRRPRSPAHDDVWVAGDGRLVVRRQRRRPHGRAARAQRYEPGETARLQVRMPFRAATALVTVEREGVLDALRHARSSGGEPRGRGAGPADYAPNVVRLGAGRARPRPKPDAACRPTARVDRAGRSRQAGVQARHRRDPRRLAAAPARRARSQPSATSIACATRPR